MKQKRPAKLDRATELMMLGETDEAIALKLDVSRITVWRWRNRGDTTAILGAHRNRELERISKRMTSLVDKALDVVEEVLEDPSVGAMARLKAATTLLDRAGITERGAIDGYRESRKAETDQARYLERLEDPMDPLYLLEGFGS